MNYNNFSRKDSWFDPDDYSPEYECDNCKTYQNVIDDASKNAREIVKQLYSTNIDLSILESFVDELCYTLGIEPGKGQMAIQKRREINLINTWAEFTNESLQLSAR